MSGYIPQTRLLEPPDRERALRPALLPFDSWWDLIFVPVFLWFFTARLVPEAAADRSIYQSVAERMIAGDRLYVDVLDNKDPLFYYAVVVQRLLGPIAEYGFELLCVVGSSLIAAGFARSLYPNCRSGYRLVLIATAFMLTGTHYDQGGTIPPGIFLTLVTIALASARRSVTCGLALGALLFTKLIYAPIALTFVLSYTVARSRGGRLDREFLAKCGLACAAASVAVLLLLSARGELHGYWAAQQANLLYATSNVFFASSLLENLRNHVITALYFGTPILLVSLAAVVLLARQIVRPSADGTHRAFIVACLATYPVSLGVVCLTVIWGPHMAVLYVFVALAMAAVIPDLLSRSRLLLAYPAILGTAWLLSGAGPGDWLAIDPREFLDRLEDLGSPSPEAVWLHRIAGEAPVRYARLGSDNDIHHASGTRSDTLVCPQFFQYRFTDAKQLHRILECAATADYLIVDLPEDEPLTPGNFVTPVADFSGLNRRWQIFTANIENLLKRNFECVSGEDMIRICKRVRLGATGPMNRV